MRVHNVVYVVCHVVEEMTEYEQERRKNIAENKRQLALFVPASSLLSSSEPTVKRQRGKAKGAPPQPVRRSARHRSSSSSTTSPQFDSSLQPAPMQKPAQKDSSPGTPRRSLLFSLPAVYIVRTS